MNIKETGCPRGAIFYDAVLVLGGAEAVTLEMAGSLDAEAVCVDFCLERYREAWSDKRFKLVELGNYRGNAFLRYIKGIWNFTHNTGSFSAYDWIIYSGSYAPCAVHQHKHSFNILYCHTIPRFAYDLRDYWLERAKWWQYPFLLLLIFYVKKRYEAAFQEMDVIIANSENVRKRIHRYLKRDSVVVHPPCDTLEFTWLGQEGYYLSCSRLEPYKRVRRVVEAFMKMPDKQLVVASGGSELETLKEVAAGAQNIRFTGWVSRKDLVELVGNAIATIYIPVDEDFGMSPVESMSAGKPVIGVAEGGLLETVLPGKTGTLLRPNPPVCDLVEAVERMPSHRALSMRRACEKRAAAFSRSEFNKKIKTVLEARIRPA